MVSFIALYWGKSIRTASLLSVSSDPAIVHTVLSHLLQVPEDTRLSPPGDSPMRRRLQQLAHQDTPMGDGEREGR